MITKHELDSAIAECRGEPNPNAQTCIKLASYYTIYDHMYNDVAKGNQVSGSDSEFGKLVENRPWEEVFPVIDELMNTLKLLHPKLYQGVLMMLEK